MSVEKIRNIYSFIPATDIFRMKVYSKKGTEIDGVYIETFIYPKKLGPQYITANIGKVIAAVEHAKKTKRKK
jgi:predicted amino acid dehydrogenase